ncbi:membrane protein required for colicin V production [Methylomarinovum caldicuralii]|uniref:Membrane protein required for colicin V production n=1 Tax=Methylomarinovum caldicuralii TaxID=438856 RepID=A0AAU9CQU9_9GAMM|nr:membrane protein required for colicin V production [Methylomarinovum caldicuralii]
MPLYNRGRISALLWIDYAILAVVVVSALLGFVRGLVQESFALLSWIAALWVALHFHPAMAYQLESVLPHPTLRIATAFVILFVATLLVGKLTGFLLATLVEHSPLSVLNRLGGFVFGAGRGVLLIAAVVLLAQNFELDRESWWRTSRLLPHAERWANTLGRLDPKPYLQRYRLPSLPL